MTDTRRTTTGINWHFWRRGALSQSTPAGLSCQEVLKFTLVVPAHGREIFLPQLEVQRVYQITIHGTCTHWRRRGNIFHSKEEVCADALYHTDVFGNFVEPHAWVRICGSPLNRFFKCDVAEVMPRENRVNHEYTFRIDGANERIPVSFWIESKWLVTAAKGELKLTVELLPEGTPSPLSSCRRALGVVLGRRVVAESAKREQKATEETAKLERKTAQENAARAEQAATEKAVLETRLRELRLRVHCGRHFLDPEFQQHFARHDTKAILNRHKPEWTWEYADFMRDAPLKQLAEEKAPEVLEWLEAKVKIVQLAERFMVAPSPAVEVKIEQPKKVLTAEERRAAKLQKHADEVDDKIALMKLTDKKLAEVDEVALDEDLKARLRSEIEESILDGAEEHEGRNGDVTL